MNFFKGLTYNLKGLKLGLTTPKLLGLGLLRVVIVVALTIAAASVVLAYHDVLSNQLWTKPHSAWLVWLWHLVDWLLVLLLIVVASVLAYLAGQVVFCAVIMDLMSRLTEKKIAGHAIRGPEIPVFRQMLYLMRQEIPRAVVPVLVGMVLFIVGWLTPLGPFFTLLSSGITAIFLAWDNTDLIPARQMLPFRQRWQMLVRNPALHLGFGLLFLIPVANILFLSFAPVGAALYHLDKESPRH